MAKGAGRGRVQGGGRGPAASPWGLQERQTVPGVKEFVAPDPSSRSTVAYAERLAQFRALAALVAPHLGTRIP